MGMTIDYRGGLDDPAQDESGYDETGNLEALMRLQQSIDDALNNLELIARLTRYATAGNEVELPDAEQLAGRLN